MVAERVWLRTRDASNRVRYIKTFIQTKVSKGGKGAIRRQYVQHILWTRDKV